MFQSTRLFPKNQGATGYVLTGLAAKCDWVFCSDAVEPYTYLHRITDTDQPRYIFLSLRSPFVAIKTFVEEVLPQINAPFTLISGSEDITIPNQIDKRWRPFSLEEKALLLKLHDNPLLCIWYAENMDEAFLPKMRSIPLGMVYPNNAPDKLSYTHEVHTQASRQLSVLCSHRVRSGEQWATRKKVSELAGSSWSAFTSLLTNEVNEQEFIKYVESHSFVLCVEGGGLDPSPKAWQSIYHGAIPIIRRNPTSNAYADLPVAFVDSWEAKSLTPTLLQEWKRTLSPWYDDRKLRRETLYRLSENYWWNKVTNGKF